MQLKLLPEKTETNRPRRLIIPCFETFFDESGDRPALADGAQTILRFYESREYDRIAIANTGHRTLSFDDLIAYFQSALQHVPWIQAIAFFYEGAGYWVTHRSAMAYVDRNLPPGDRPGIGAIWLAKHVITSHRIDSGSLVGHSDVDMRAALASWCDYLDFNLDFNFLKEDFCE